MGRSWIDRPGKPRSPSHVRRPCGCPSCRSVGEALPAALNMSASNIARRDASSSDRSAATGAAACEAHSRHPLSTLAPRRRARDCMTTAAAMQRAEPDAAMPSARRRGDETLYTAFRSLCREATGLRDGEIGIAGADDRAPLLLTRFVSPPGRFSRACVSGCSSNIAVR